MLVTKHNTPRARARRTPAGRRRLVPPAASPTACQRRGDGPDDQALYACHCGAAFRADVTATVDCPACGATQDW